jgi:hypothetical protein
MGLDMVSMSVETPNPNMRPASTSIGMVGNPKMLAEEKLGREGGREEGRGGGREGGREGKGVR